MIQKGVPHADALGFHPHHPFLEGEQIRPHQGGKTNRIMEKDAWNPKIWVSYQYNKLHTYNVYTYTYIQTNT